MIYLDFAKAFDTVDHNALLAKLRLYGVKGQLFCWFKDYLTEPTQRVVLENAASHWSLVTSGIPQGSTLGPLLFTLCRLHSTPTTPSYTEMSRLQNTVTSYKTLSLICTSGRSAIILDLIRLNVKY